MLRCALPTRAHIHYPPLPTTIRCTLPYSVAIPKAISSPLLSFESYLEMMLQE
nr:MAG TPA: hypothetical protein [Caudoviricetes sp.]